jgi:hypothetical protein
MAYERERLFIGRPAASLRTPIARGPRTPDALIIDRAFNPPSLPSRLTVLPSRKLPKFILLRG